MYLFDIDGTLLLTGGCGTRVINQLFEERYSLSGAMALISAGGKTDGMIFRECARQGLGRDLEEKEVSELLAAYLPRLRQELNRANNFQLMPFARECMEFVASVQPLVGVATGNIEGTAMAKLDRADLRAFFHFGGYGSDSHVRSELVAKAMERGREQAGRELLCEEFVVVGDTLHDIEAARACGARVVAVATGAVSKAVLQAARPDAVFDTLQELPGWHHQYFSQ